MIHISPSVLGADLMRLGEEIELVLWEPEADRTVSGAIVKLDLLSYRIFIGGQWVKLASIVEVRG